MFSFKISKPSLVRLLSGDSIYLQDDHYIIIPVTSQ